MDNYYFKTFNQLELDELYEILKLRQIVFVVEQNCPYLDVDNKDQDSFHLFLKGKHGEILAYTRLLPLGISYKDYIAIGRVVVGEKERKNGRGKKMMEIAIQKSKELFGNVPIKISAQSHLQSFYEYLGFEYTGEAYLEDEIPHIGMVYTF